MKWLLKYSEDRHGMALKPEFSNSSETLKFQRNVPFSDASFQLGTFQLERKRFNYRLSNFKLSNISFFLTIFFNNIWINYFVHTRCDAILVLNRSQKKYSENFCLEFVFVIDARWRTRTFDYNELWPSITFIGSRHTCDVASCML